MPSVVLDASALLEAPFRLEAREALLGMHERFDPVAPALLAWEVGQVVHVKRPREFGADAAAREEAARLLLAGVALDVPDPAACARAARLAERHRLSYYDAAYLELATRLDGARLVTEDAALLAAARGAMRSRALDLAGAATWLLRNPEP